MVVLSWLPVALFGAVILILCGVSLGVEIGERRRMARNEAAPRRRFRPVVIQGGRVEAPAMPAARFGRGWPGQARP
jgi:hypothetical protein